MKRGDVVTVAAGSGFGGKPRPALILQSDDFAGSTVVLAIITSSTTPEESFRPRIAPSGGNGLRKISDVAVDSLITVRWEKIGSRIGALSEEDLLRVERSLMIFLGMAG
ncbi:MAG: type II toxin-antitoxin system PemK/MazF family toxin [Rhizorhabdus sp.]|nr:MAG: type II toxin-antitoxin system PemK/MazF family toxin [Rhizorhabdus sp.]